jgi:tetratricopeptide (TPR) repeat protein
MFDRERYATTARLAQALCASGEFERAVQFAEKAVDLTPEGFEYTGWKVEDQYEVIFGGRLSLIMATSDTEGHLHEARELAIRARRLARLSENPEKVSFTNREMDQAHRKETRSRFGKVAWVATGNIWTPLGARRKISQRVCAE